MSLEGVIILLRDTITVAVTVTIVTPRVHSGSPCLPNLALSWLSVATLWTESNSTFTLADKIKEIGVIFFSL